MRRGLKTLICGTRCAVAIKKPTSWRMRRWMKDSDQESGVSGQRNSGSALQRVSDLKLA